MQSFPQRATLENETAPLCQCERHQLAPPSCQRRRHIASHLPSSERRHPQNNPAISLLFFNFFFFSPPSRSSSLVNHFLFPLLLPLSLFSFVLLFFFSPDGIKLGFSPLSTLQLITFNPRSAHLPQGSTSAEQILDTFPFIASTLRSLPETPPPVPPTPQPRRS